MNLPLLFSTFYFTLSACCLCGNSLEGSKGPFDVEEGELELHEQQEMPIRGEDRTERDPSATMELPSGTENWRRLRQIRRKTRNSRAIGNEIDGDLAGKLDLQSLLTGGNRFRRQTSQFTQFRHSLSDNTRSKTVQDNSVKTEDAPPLLDMTSSNRNGKKDTSAAGGFTKGRDTSTASPVRPSDAKTSSAPRVRKKLLIGYLAGTPFGNLDELLISVPAARAKAKSVDPVIYAEQMPVGGQIIPLPGSRNESARFRRMAVPYADPDPEAYPYPDPYPDAYPDPYPLENLRIVGKNNTSATISLKDLANIFHRSDIIGTSKFVQGHQISGAMRYALEVVNSNPDLLPDYELTFKFYNTKGLSKESVKWVMELWKMGAVAFIGPEDSCQTEAMMAAAQNLPMISYKCADHSVSDKAKYGTFARTVPAEGEVAKAVVALLKHYKWYKFTIVCQADEVHRRLVEGIMYWVEKHPFMSVQNTTFYKASFIIDTRSSSDEVKKIVGATYKNTRIYVVLGDQGFLQLMMLEMGNKNLLSKGEYAVVYIDHTYGYIDPDDAAMNRYYRPTIQRADSAYTDTVVHRLMDWSRSLFVIVPTPVLFTDPDYQRFWSKVVQYNTEEPFKVYRTVSIASSASERSGVLNTQEPIYNRYASYLYDAVLLYAEALHETLQKGGHYTNGTAIMQRIYGRKYRSMQGFDVKIDSQGDAEGNFTLLTRQNISHSRYNFSVSMVPTAWFVDTAEPVGLPALALRDRMFIDWINGKPPDDEPECGFTNERCIKEPSRSGEIAGGVLAIISIAAALMGFMIYRNRKIEKELAGLIWKIDPKEIQFITQDGYAAVLGASRVTLASQDSGGQETGSLWPIDFHCLAKYRGALVAIKEIQYARKLREITRLTKMEMKKMRGLHHDNVNNFMGIIVKPNQIYVVREYCAKGSLYDVLLNENIKLDDLFTASFVDDLLKAMCYLHESEIRVHGNLKSTNCVVTSRWSLQVSDYGLHELRDGQHFENEMQIYKALLWTAPELLLAGAVDRPQKGTQKGDIFSFGIILHEIFTRIGPYGIEADCNFTAKDIYLLIVKTRRDNQNTGAYRRSEGDTHMSLVNVAKPFLPRLDDMQCQNYIKEVLLQCWNDRPNDRPDFRTIRQRLKPLFKGILRRNIMDHMMAMMEKYQNHLEQLVDERTEALNEEKKRVETLLHRMLPYSVAAQLMRGEDVIPESYDAVTIYFSDIVGFTSLSAESTPMEVVNFLNSLYTLFDSIIRRYDVYKVETIGDAYMVVSGLPIRNGDKHAGEVATMALHLLKAVETFKIPHRLDKKLLLRIGLHTGPCVAGVVGKTMPRYCLFGDTVNTASRMESNGLPLKIHCSEYVERALATLGGYILEERGLVPMKGKGEMLTYWLLAKQEFVMASPVDEFPSEPLFKTKETIRPPTGNLARRRIAAESLNQLPCRGESLTTIIRRAPSKRADTGPSSGGSKLQPAPAFSSTAGKPQPSVGGCGSSRSRLLLPTLLTDGTNGGSQLAPTDHNRRKLPPGLVGMPPSYQDCVRAATAKRPSLRASSKAANSRGMRGLGAELQEEEEIGMRKRSVSFPENVQALAEQFIALGLTKDGRCLAARDANRNMGESSSIASSAVQTPKGKSPALTRHCTPDVSCPRNLNCDSSAPSQLNVEYDPWCGAPKDSKQNGAVGNWDKMERRSTLVPTKTENGGRCYEDTTDEDDENSPAPRKRSLSCSDADNVFIIGSGPCQLMENTLTVPQYSEQASSLASASSLPRSPQQQGSARSLNASYADQSVVKRADGSPLAARSLNHIQPDRAHTALLVENTDENSPSDSPLLLKTSHLLPMTGLDGDLKRKRKTALSLQAFSRPFHSVWQGQNALERQDPSAGSCGVMDAGGENKFNRFLRYLKRPTSDDRVELSGDSRQANLV